MPTINHEISLAAAVELTTRFRDSRPADMPLYESFPVAAVQRLLATIDCRYLRIYLGRKTDNEVVFVLVGADEQEQDLLPSGEAALAADDGPVIIEDGYRCPRYCPSASVLATGI